MLSLFPQILFLAPAGLTLLRLTLAFALVYCAWNHLTEESLPVRGFAIIEIAIALGLAAGYWTQVAALLATLQALLLLSLTQVRVLPRSSALFMLVIALTLLVSGPGAFAFDLPL